MKHFVCRHLKEQKRKRRTGFIGLPDEEKVPKVHIPSLLDPEWDWSRSPTALKHVPSTKTLWELFHLVRNIWILIAKEGLSCIVVGTPTWKGGMWFLLHKCLHRAGKPHGLQLVCFCPRMLSRQKRLWPFFFFGVGKVLDQTLSGWGVSQLPLDFSRANYWLLERKQWPSAPLADVMHRPHFQAN